MGWVSGGGMGLRQGDVMDWPWSWGSHMGSCFPGPCRSRCSSEDVCSRHLCGGECWAFAERHSGVQRSNIYFFPVWVEKSFFLFFIFKSFLLFNYSWHTKLYCLQEYTPVIRHLCNFLSDHPDKSHTHLTPHTVIRILLSLFPMLHFTSLWLFCNNQFVLLNAFTFFTHSTKPPFIWQLSICSLYLWVFFYSASLFILFFRFNSW